MAGLSLQRQRDSRSKGGQAADDRPAYGCRHILQQLWHGPWVEICKLNLKQPVLCLPKAAGVAAAADSALL